MASLDLGTLKVGVKVDGAEKAKQDLKGVESATKNVENSASSSSKGVKLLSGSFKDTSSNATGFSAKLGDLGGAMGGGIGASALLAGAVGGLAVAFVDMAKEVLQYAIMALVEFGKQSVQVASDLQESANVVNVVFGEDNKVAKWSEECASGFNLSTLEAQKFAGTMGAVLTPTNLGKDTIQDMSITLTQLSGDLGSLWNKSSKEAFNALRSAITGETEPMKQFGVVMTQVNLEAYALSEGINKSWKEMNQAEQATLRYNYILANTKTSQGDAARTADGYANSTKGLELAMQDAANAMGGGFLPGLASAKRGLADFVDDNKETIAFIGNVLGVITTAVVESIRVIGLTFKPIIATINGIAGVLNPIVSGINELFSMMFTSITDNGSKTANGVAYEMQDMAETSKIAMSEASGSMVDSFKDAGESITSELDIVKEGLQKFYDEELAEYRKSLEERYAGANGEITKNERILIEKKMAAKKESSDRSMAYEVKKEEEKINKLNGVYNTDKSNFDKNEEAKTLKVEEETKKRMGFWSKIFSSGESNTSNTSSASYTSNRHANGTLSAQGGWTTVGEAGRELMYIPSRTQIFNNNTTEKILGGGGTTINIDTVQANNIGEFLQSLEMYQMAGGML